jgi:hypothetical protein
MRRPRREGYGCGAIVIAFALGVASTLLVVRWVSRRAIPESAISSAPAIDVDAPAPIEASAGPSRVKPREPDAKRFTAGDAAYAEPEGCEALADVTALAVSYRPGGIRAAAEGLARARYPDGLAFLQAQDDKALATWFRGAPETFEGVASRFEAAVHEGSHVWVAKRFDPRTVAYPVRGDLTVRTLRLKNFDRAEILPLRSGSADETYATTYLTGRSGAQGFNTLLDEYNAYTHTLAARFCTRDLLASNTRVSARDGALAMMYYVGLYLRVARERHPADYSAILGDAGHRRLILVVWSRAEFWLRRSAPFVALGVRDDELEGLAYSDDGLAELARVRSAEAADACPTSGCTSSP